MFEKNYAGMVEAINGLVVKKNLEGAVSILKTGEQVSIGEELVLLSGSAEFADSSGVHIMLKHNAPFHVDEVNIAFKTEPKLSSYEHAIKLYQDLGLDPSAALTVFDNLQSINAVKAGDEARAIPGLFIGNSLSAISVIEQPIIDGFENPSMDYATIALTSGSPTKDLAPLSPTINLNAVISQGLAVGDADYNLNYTMGPNVSPDVSLDTAITVSGLKNAKLHDISFELLTAESGFIDRFTEQPIFLEAVGDKLVQGYIDLNGAYVPAFEMHIDNARNFHYAQLRPMEVEGQDFAGIDEVFSLGLGRVNLKVEVTSDDGIIYPIMVNFDGQDTDSIHYGLSGLEEYEPVNFGMGNDELIISDQFITGMEDDSYHTVASENSIETATIEGFDDIVIDGARLLQILDGGWEFLDPDGQGSHQLILDYHSISTLSEGSNASLELQEGGNVPGSVLQLRASGGDDGHKLIIDGQQDSITDISHQITGLHNNEKVYQVMDSENDPPVYVHVIGMNDALPIIEIPLPVTE